MGYNPEGRRRTVSVVDAPRVEAGRRADNSSRRIIRMKKPILVLCLVLVAGVALASNTGFKLNYNLRQSAIAGASNENWVAVPYFYFPNGNVGQTPQSAEDFCRDLNSPTPKDNSKVGQVVRYDTVNDAAQTKFCNNTVPVFNLIAGEGYSLKPRADNTVIDIVGSHDDTYAPNKGGTKCFSVAQTSVSGGSNIALISVPYHSIANNSEDLCRALNSPTPKDNTKIGQVVRYDTVNDAAATKFCNNTVNLFDLVPGEGYGAKGRTGQTPCMGMDVY